MRSVFEFMIKKLNIFTVPLGFENRLKQGNRGDIRKIHVTRQFFEASGRHGDLIEKKPFLDKVDGSMCAKFQVCIFFSLARRRDNKINKYIHKYTSEFKYILNRLIASRGFWLFVLAH